MMSVDISTRLEIEDFLHQEAELLDDRKYREWLELFVDDAYYEMPIQVTREKDAEWQISPRAKIIDDTRQMLKLRVERLYVESAWAENPPSRTRRFVTNIRIRPSENPNEFRVRSNVLLYRNRGSSPDFDILVADRQDTLRRVNGSWKIAHRRVILDQSTINSNNVSVFF